MVEFLGCYAAIFGGDFNIGDAIKHWC